jgi:regulator of sigma E protease
MTPLLFFIIVIGPLIFFHELGHFLVAKKSGIRVEKFSLGFGPRIFGKKIGDTEYRVSWLPFGGYVKMAGEDPDETKLEGKPWEFMSKPVGVRALVVAAGPVMNVILAIFIFWGIFFFAGQLKIHDESTQVGLVSEGGPADEAGLAPGDEIVSINGVEVNSFSEMARIIHKQVEKPIEVKWIHEGEEFSAQITTFKDKVLNEEGEMQEIGKIGVGPSYTSIKVGFFKSFLEAVDWTVFVLVETIKFLVGLVTGTVSVKLVGGPILIAQMAGESAKSGFIGFLSFMGLLSINLALINVLPIPVLDGGHLMFLSIEKLKGTPMSLRQRATMQQIGLAFLILLMIFLTYNDLLRAIK